MSAQPHPQTSLSLAMPVSLMDILDRIEGLHNCLHAHVEKTDTNFTDLKKDLGAVDIRLARVEGAQGVIGHTMGIQNLQNDAEPVKVKKTLLSVTPAQAVWGALGSAGVAVGGYKIVWAIMQAIHAALLASPA